MSDLTALETLPPHDAPCPLEFVAAALAARDEVKRLRARVAELGRRMSYIDADGDLVVVLPQFLVTIDATEWHIVERPGTPEAKYWDGIKQNEAIAVLAAAPAQTKGGE